MRKTAAKLSFLGGKTGAGVDHTWPINLDQLLLMFARCISNHDPPSKAEIAIEPCMPQATSIRLDTNLYKAFALLLAHRLHA